MKKYRRTKSSYKEQLQRLVNEYIKAGQPWPAKSRAIARWAIENNQWKPCNVSIQKMCARDISSAMRDEYHTDAQGRRVRTKHAAKFPGEEPGEGMTLWGDIITSPREFLERAFSQRRSQIVGDCSQLKTDVDSFNDNRAANDPIELLLDFSDDVAELELDIEEVKTDSVVKASSTAVVVRETKESRHLIGRAAAFRSKQTR